MAFSVALSHRNIAHHVFDSDPNPTHRHQGYSLTLQHSRAPSELNLTLPKQLSTRHVVLDPDGDQIAAWGRSLTTDLPPPTQKHNFHLSRTSLRASLLTQTSPANISWGKTFHSCTVNDDSSLITLNFADATSHTANLLVGADGVHSVVRSYTQSPELHPLTTCNVTCALGIFTPPADGPLHHLLDHETVVQIADGHTSRLYLQPYNETQYMWQFSYRDEPFTAKQTPSQILDNVCEKSKTWLNEGLAPLLSNTSHSLVSSYSLVDRTLPPHFRTAGNELVTLLGDAAHPMTPFKGWGANSALADGLGLARAIHTAGGVGEHVLEKFERIMIKRVEGKVKSSREAVDKLHGAKVLTKSNVTRGSL